MSPTSLKDRLYRYLLKSHGWIASGDLQRIVVEKTAYTAQNAGRRLRELVNEGMLEVQYRKGHAYYRAVEKKEPRQVVEHLPNGHVRVTYV